MITIPEGTARNARAEERSRIKAILSSPEAEGRTAHVIKLALETDMAPAAAAALLNDFPKSEAGASAVAPAIPSRAQRASNGREIGPAGADAAGMSGDAAQGGWDKAVARVNAGR